MSGILQSFAYGRAFTSPPVNVTAPAITGTAQARQALVCSTGTWTGLPTPTFTYQWQFGVSNTNISGATSNTYTVAGTYVGQTIRCVVTATNSSGAVSANSNSTSAVTANTPAAPTIGTATATAYNTATVAYTAPSENGGATITTYTATSSPGSITGTLSTAGSGTITVTGLSGSTSYTFTVTATNSVGVGPASSASNSITTPVQQFYYVMQSRLTTNEVPPAQLFIQPGTSGPVVQLQSGGGAGNGARWGYGVINTSNLTINTGSLVGETTYPSTKFGAYAGSSYNYAMFNAYGRQGAGTTGMVLFRTDNVSSGSVSQGFANSYTFSGRANASTANDMYALTYDSSANQVITTFAWPKLVYVPCCCGYNVNVYVGAIVKTNGATGAATWGIVANFTSAYNTVQMYLYSVAVHPANGNVYVVGQVYIDCVGTQNYIAKFNSSGTLQWHKYYSQSGGNTSFSYIALDSSENLFVAGGNGTLYKLNSSGTFQWGSAVGSSTGAGIATVKFGSDGSIYAQGSWYNGTQAEGSIVKLNSSGTVQWQRAYYNASQSNSGDFGTNLLALDSSDNVYLGMKSVAGGGNSANVIFKVAPDGSGASGTARTISNATSQSYYYYTTTKAVTSPTLGGGTDVGSKYTWGSFTVSAPTALGVGAATSTLYFTPLATAQIT